MPGLEAVHRELGNQVSFVGIDEQDTRSAAIGFLHREGVTYPSGFDRQGTAAQAFGIPGTPTTYFVSGGLERGISYGALTPPRLRTLIQEYLGVTGSPS
jgi:hypothetical protein